MIEVAPVIHAAPAWGLVSYTVNGDEPQAGVRTADGVIRSLDSELPPATLLSLLRRWEDVSPRLDAIEMRNLSPVADAELDLPLRLPAKMLFAGANYYDHATEMGTPVPEGIQPYFFMKPPSTTLIGDGDVIRIDETQLKIDWEAELGLVIGRSCRKLSYSDAGAVIAGYVVLNDITDRARLARPAPVLGPPFAFDWLSSKGMDSSCPMSSAVVPASLIPDPHALTVRLWVNDRLKQESSTANMVADIPSLLVALTDVMTLEPGDIVATGTPAGVGAAHGEFLRSGDVVTADVEGVGRVSNTIKYRE